MSNSFRLSILTTPVRGEKGFYSEPYFPIVVYLAEDLEPSSKLNEWWSTTCFPMRVNIGGHSATFQSGKHQAYKESMLVNSKEIGAYIPATDSLVIDRELLLHYIMSGCRLNGALTRMLKRLVPELPLYKQLGLRELVSPDSWKLQDRAALLEKHDSVIAAISGKKKKKSKR